MIRVNIAGSLNGIRDQLQATQKEASKAASRALNRTATRVRTYSSRAIRAAGYNLKAGVIKRNLKITKASPGILAATVTAVGKSIPLIDYSARQTKTGVSVNVLHGRKTVRHAFIATMPSGHKGVFIRRDARTGGVKGLHRAKGARTSGKHGLPIDQLFGPGIPAAFVNPAVEKAMTEQATTYFPVEMLRQLGFVLSKRT